MQEFIFCFLLHNFEEFSRLKYLLKVSGPQEQHCVNSVRIRSFLWSIFSRMWTEYGDLRGNTRIRKTPNMGTFYAVQRPSCVS